MIWFRVKDSHFLIVKIPWLLCGEHITIILYCSSLPPYVLQSQIHIDVISSKRFYWSHNNQIENILWHHWTQCFIFLVIVQMENTKTCENKGHVPTAMAQRHLSISNWCNKCLLTMEECDYFKGTFCLKHFSNTHTFKCKTCKLIAPEKQQGVLADYNITVVMYWYSSS